MKRAIVSGGGTGGHFYPGLSIARALIENGWQIVFAVKKNDICLGVLQKDEIPYVEIDVVPLPRSINPLRYLIFLIKLVSSLLYCRRIIKDFAPEVVIGTGSYVAFPMIVAAWFCGIKTLIHESNTVMGISNRFSAMFANKILMGLPIKDNPYPKKSILTGTPIRNIFFQKIDKNTARQKLGFHYDSFVLLIFGGSQGSQNINDAFYKILLDFQIEKKKINFIQITGRSNYQQVKGKYKEAGLDKGNIVFDYYEDMPVVYSAADAVIARSGSGTISELMKTKKPAILIPLKTASGDHQTLNALELAKHGCAIVIRDDEKLKENLSIAIGNLLTFENIKAMERGYERLEIPSPEKSIEKILEVLK